MKELFLKWLEVERQSKQDAGSKQSFVLHNAIKSLKGSPAEYSHPKQLQPLKYFGTSIIGMLTSKMKKWCEETGNPYQDYQENAVDSGAGNAVGKRSREDEEKSGNDGEPVRKTRREYKPTFRSGGFGILLSLHLHDSNHYGLHKAEIVLHASKYSDAAFTATNTTNKSYTAWSSMKTLISKDLVEKIGNPPRFALTDTGEDLAAALKLTWDAHTEAEGGSITKQDSSPIRAGNNRLILDNTNNPLASSSNVNTANNSMLGGPVDEIFTLPSKGIHNSVHVTSSPLRQQTVNNKQHGKSFMGVEYCVWEPESYNIVFMLDKREVAIKSDREKFYNDLKSKDIGVKSRNLPIGDGAWVAINKQTKQEAILDHLFERKRLDDLVSSIKDNRFREQESRLKKSGLKRIMYLIEEDMGLKLDGDAEMVKTAMTMMNTHLKATLVRTRDYESTVKYIAELDKVIAGIYKNKRLLVLEPRNVESQDHYLSILETMRTQFEKEFDVVYKYDIFDALMQKKSSLRVKDLFIQCLKRVKGMSLDKAVMIQRRYKTPSNLIKAYKCYTGDKGLMLQEVFADELGSRKINKVVSQRVAEVWTSVIYTN